MTWKSRELQSLTLNGVKTEFTYNADGLRTSKKTGDVLHSYIWSGDMLLAEVTADYTLRFLYNGSGEIIGFEHITASTTDTDITYYYEKNIFGDVVAIYDEAGNPVAAYAYNAYGQNHVVTNLTDDRIASLNPIRYRSYYYDSDIYLYYLQSRYYDTVTCRFINADAFVNANGDIIGYNMFAYCSNNPVMFTDPSGQFVISISALVGGIAISAAIGAAIAFGSIAYKDYDDDGELFNGSRSIGEYVGYTIGGLIAGAGVGACSILGTGLGVAMVAGETLVIGGMAFTGGAVFGTSILTSFTTGGVGYLARTLLNDKESFEASDMLIEAGANTASGLVSFVGGYVGGATGVHMPGKNGILNTVKYQCGMAYFGAYTIKYFISKIKKSLQEIY